MDNKLFVLSRQSSVANHFLAELRDASLQLDRLKFRRNMERLGEILAYEVSKSFPYERRTVRTPLGETSVELLKEYPVLITILRAGIALHQGFLNIFDRSDSGFVGAYRVEGSSSVSINTDYLAIPATAGRMVVLVDPMLATGKSLVAAHKLMLAKGKPAHLHIASVVAAPEGIRYLEENLQIPYSLWTCAVDERLDEAFYIVPGLGDAGDLSYGPKT